MCMTQNNLKNVAVGKHNIPVIRITCTTCNAAADPTQKQKTLYQHREDPLKLVSLETGQARHNRKVLKWNYLNGESVKVVLIDPKSPILSYVHFLDKYIP